MSELPLRPARPLPSIDADSEPFWEACRASRLLLQKCARCGLTRYPPRPMCPRCSSLESAWIEAVGSGSVYSWAVAHDRAAPSYAMVLVELDEGPRVFSNLLDVAPNAIQVGMRVEVVFKKVSELITLPYFVVATSAREATADNPTQNRANR